METVDVRTDLDYPVKGLSDWKYSRPSHEVSTWKHPSPPPGISLLTVSRTPTSRCRVRLEGNLTTALYGLGSAVGSLERSEVPAAAGALLTLAEEATGRTLPAPSAWDLHRGDPSTTLLLPEGHTVRDVVLHLHREWMLRRNRRQTVTLVNDQTVTFQHSGWHAWSVYDKTAEALRRGHPCPPRAMRLEARVRPRKGSGAWKAARTTLDLNDNDWSLIMTELDAMQHDLVTKLAGVTLAGMIRALERGGASPNAAHRLAARMLLEQALGRDSVADTLPTSTAERWRAEARKFYTAGGGDDAYEADGEAMVPLLARDLALPPDPA